MCRCLPMRWLCHKRTVLVIRKNSGPTIDVIHSTKFHMVIACMMMGARSPREDPRRPARGKPFLVLITPKIATCRAMSYVIAPPGAGIMAGGNPASRMPEALTADCV